MPHNHPGRSHRSAVESNTPYLIIRLCIYLTSVFLYLITTVIDELDQNYNIWVCI